MGVVDIAVGQESVEENFHRRIRRGGLDLVNPQLVFHLLVGKGGELFQLAQRFQFQTYKIPGFDGGQIDPAAL